MAPPHPIVVIGAGIVGCAIAHELARRGARVEIVDDRPAGMGATQASAGVLAPFIEARHEGPLLELTARSLDLFDQFVACVAADSGMPLTYARTGTLDVALRGEGLQHLAATREVLVKRGVAADLLGPSALLAREPGVSPRAIGGLFIPFHGFVGALQLTRALAAAARRFGAALTQHGRVRGIAGSGADLAVDTERGPIAAAAVVLAAGSWAGQIAVAGARARVPVTPVRGQLLRLEWTGPVLRGVIWGERCYVVPWPDGTVLVGATVEDVGFDEGTTEQGLRELSDAVCELVPGSRAARVTSAVAGLRPGTPDQLPIIGWSRALPNVMYATGHYRNGILLAPLTARLVADAVLDGVVDPMLAWTDPARFGEV